MCMHLTTEIQNTQSNNWQPKEEIDKSALGLGDFI